MPTLDEVKEQLKAANVVDTFGTKKEIKYLPEILTDDETVKYLTSGFYDKDTWVIVCTNKRIIFLDKGMIYGLKQVEIPLDRVNSIGQTTGLVFGTIEIWDGASKMFIKDVMKQTVKPFVAAANKAIEEYKNAKNNNSSNSNNQSNDIASQIMKLSQLKEQGILTEDEFLSKKKELLDKM